MTWRLNFPFLASFVFIFLHILWVWKTPAILPASSLPLRRSSETSRVATIVLLHMYDSVHFFQRLGKLTGENKERYAKRHGYEIVVSSPHRTSGILKPAKCFDGSILNVNETTTKILGPDSSGKCWAEDSAFDIDHSRAPTFGKIKLSLATCVGRPHAWLFWADADSIIINQSLPLENIIDDAYDLIFSYDWLMLNAGMLLIKCSQWALTFLKNVYDARRFDSARALDQSALQEFIDHLSEVDRRAHIKVIPKHAMDVYTEEYRPGDFLMHFAGKLYEATEPGLFAIANQYDILSTVDDVEDIEAFFRGRHVLNYYSGTCKLNFHEKQRDCPPDDPRRISLNESLGSMSYPNRYRHVGLRYYWLGTWRDKYDVPGWNQFEKPLTIVSREEREQYIQFKRSMVPDALHHHYDGHRHFFDGKADHDTKLGFNLDEGNGDNDGVNNGNENDSVKNGKVLNQHEINEHEKNHHGPPEVYPGLKMDGGKDAHRQQHYHGDAVGNKDDDELSQHIVEDDENSEPRSYVWIFVTSVAVGAACLFVSLTRRRKVSSKTQ